MLLLLPLVKLSVEEILPLTEPETTPHGSPTLQYIGASDETRWGVREEQISATHNRVASHLRVADALWVDSSVVLLEDWNEFDDVVSRLYATGARPPACRP